MNPINPLNDNFEQGFIQTGIDDLSKAMDKGKLVQKEIQVKGKNGQTHTRKQWVRNGEEPKSEKKPKAQEEPKEKKSSGNVDLGDRSKGAIVNALQSGASRTDIMSTAESQGITWKKSDHEGINWMRASMAIQGINSRGQKVEQPTEKAQEITEDTKNSVESDINASEQNSSEEKSKPDINVEDENSPEFTEDNFEDLSVGEFLEQAESDGFNNACEQSGLKDDAVIISTDTTNDINDISNFLDSAKLLDSYDVGGGEEANVYEKNGIKFVYHSTAGNQAIMVNREDVPNLNGKQPSVSYKKSTDKLFLKTSKQPDVFQEARNYFKNNPETVESAKSKVTVNTNKNSAASLFAKNTMLSGGLVSTGADGKTYYEKVSDTVLSDLMENISIDDSMEVTSGKDTKSIKELRPFLSEVNTVLDKGYNDKPIVVSDGSGYLGDKLGTVTTNGYTYDVYSGPNSGNSPTHVVAVNKSAPKRLSNFRKNLQTQLAADDMFKEGITTQSKAMKALTKMGLDWDRESLENYAKEYTPQQAGEFVQKLYGHWNMSPTQIKAETNKAKEELQARDWMLSKLK